MGVKGLRDLISSAEETSLKNLGEKKQIIGIDAFNTIYAFLATIRDPTGQPMRSETGRITSPIIGLFNRTTRMLQSGIEPVFVFDGVPPRFKQKELEERRAKKIEEKAKLQEAVDREDFEAARKHAVASMSLREQIVEDSKQLLKLLGVGIVVAPEEGEAQMAQMALQGQISACASQDYDTLLFGAPRLIRNVSFTQLRSHSGQRIPNPPEEIWLEQVLSDLDFTREQLILLGMVIGSDYSKVSGYGPKKGLQLVRKHPTADALFSYLEKTADIVESFKGNDPREIFEYFLNPPFDEEASFKMGKANIRGVYKFLVDDLSFDEARVKATLSRLKKMQAQKSLDTFF
ncbi:MAG: flap structure-specific endonuclease [Candidatus Heimdallarchaeota archaeon]